MIAQLRGTIVHRSPTEIIIDVQGVGYHLNITLTTYTATEQRQGEVTLFTYLHVREDALQLYGFATEAEREMFRQLISVSGIGPRMAQGILSGLNPTELRDAITHGNLVILTSISGVGRKTAERLIIELRDKIGKTEHVPLTVAPTSADMKIRAEAVVALLSLGFTRQSAERAIQLILATPGGRELPVEELVRQALRHAGK